MASADKVAVGVPFATPVIANCDELVAVPPMRKSFVVFLSKIAPFAWLSGEPPLATGRIPVTSVVRSTRLLVSVPFAKLWTTPAVPNCDRTVVPLIVVVAPV